MCVDVAIIGGGAIGVAAAYFLRSHPRTCRIAVIERDTSYQLASTPRASGGVRRLFSLPENIALSNFSIPFFERFGLEMAVNGEPAAINFRKGGYLFIAPPAAVRVLERNFETQKANGVRVEWLDRKGLKDRFPSMNVEDLGAGVLSPDDGWLDPYGVLQGLRKKARALGAEFVNDEVVGLDVEQRRLRAIRLNPGRLYKLMWSSTLPALGRRRSAQWRDGRSRSSRCDALSITSKPRKRSSRCLTLKMPISWHFGQRGKGTSAAYQPSISREGTTL